MPQYSHSNSGYRVCKINCPTNSAYWLFMRLKVWIFREFRKYIISCRSISDSLMSDFALTALYYPNYSMSIAYIHFLRLRAVTQSNGKMPQTQCIDVSDNLTKWSAFFFYHEFKHVWPKSDSKKCLIRIRMSSDAHNA